MIISILNIVAAAAVIAISYMAGALDAGI